MSIVFARLRSFAITMMVVETDNILWGRSTSTPRQGDDRTTYSSNDEAPMRQCIICRGCRWKREYHEEKQLIEDYHPNTTVPVRFGPNNLGRMRLTLHATRRAHYMASRLVIECDPGRAKTRRAPPRHCRGEHPMGLVASSGNETVQPASNCVS